MGLTTGSKLWLCKDHSIIKQVVFFENHNTQIVLVCSNFSVNNRACRKVNYVSEFLSVLFFKFYIWRLWVSPKNAGNNSRQ